MLPHINIIVAHSKNMAIGKANSLPWRLPDDLKRFKKLTTGHPIIMGRKTYQSINRPLPDRTNIVVTRDMGLEIPGCVVVHSAAEAIKKAYSKTIGKEDALTEEIMNAYGLSLASFAIAKKFELERQADSSR